MLSETWQTNVTATRVRKQRKSPMQDAVLEFLGDWKADPVNDGNSPTYKQIADALDKYPSAIYQFVQALERKGMVKVNRYGKIVLIGGKYLRPE